MQRYLLVEGKLDGEGHPYLVTNPHHVALQTGAAVRYVGLKPRDKQPEEELYAGDRWEPAQEVIVDHHDLRRAIADGCLTLLGQGAGRTREAAVEQIHAAMNDKQGAKDAPRKDS